jgi:hypothetical protein
MRKPVTTFLLMLYAAFAVSQHLISESRDLIEWNEYYDLSWEDFQGQPGTKAIGDAGTAIQIKAHPYYIKDVIQYDVEAFFDRGKSWARGHSDALLQHERLHFDIAELYARKIRKKISDMSKNGVHDVHTYNAAIQILLEESNDADQRYDLETLHGALTKKQAIWEQQVKEQLLGLRDYKKRKRIISANEALKNQPLIFDKARIISRQG